MQTLRGRMRTELKASCDQFKINRGLNTIWMERERFVIEQSRVVGEIRRLVDLLGANAAESVESESVIWANYRVGEIMAPYTGASCGHVDPATARGHRRLRPALESMMYADLLALESGQMDTDERNPEVQVSITAAYIGSLRMAVRLLGEDMVRHRFPGAYRLATMSRDDIAAWKAAAA